MYATGTDDFIGPFEGASTSDLIEEVRWVHGADEVRLAEVFRLAEVVRPAVWPGWEATSFPVLLVASEDEYLIGSDLPPDDFEHLGSGATLDREVWRRPRRFSPEVTAAFPAFDAEPVVVIGRAEAIGRTSTGWVLTVLHEHFHQYQMSHPGYLSSVAALDLSGGDETAMWMLNYPFPYDTEDVATAFAETSRELGRLLDGSSAGERQRFWKMYETFLDGVGDLDRRYLCFQMWQEGVARYVELRVAEGAADEYVPTDAFRELPDAVAFSVAAREMRRSVLDDLATPDLPRRKRGSFYAFGTGLALLLEHEDRSWMDRYWTSDFRIERCRRT